MTGNGRPEMRGAKLRGSERATYVAGMFNRISSRYDLLNTVMTAGRHHAWRRLAAKLAMEDSTGPALDVASGTGDFALALAAMDRVTRVVGLDFASRMLSLAGSKAGRGGVSGKLDIMRGDAHALPFRDGEFACATVGFGVRNFVDVSRSLDEMVRVVRTGGRVVVLEIVRVEGRSPLQRAMPLVFRYATPWLGALLAGDREAYTYLPESVEEFLSARELAGLMVNAGLADVRHRSLALGGVAILVGTKKPAGHAPDGDITYPG